MAHHHNYTSTGATLQPTYIGHISSTTDALVLFEAYLTGYLSFASRRPYDRERPNLIRSGSIFIYEEHSRTIKRWTDGVPWSPSRILDNFLLYRELDKPSQSGERKRARKKENKSTNGVSAHHELKDGLSWIQWHEHGRLSFPVFGCIDNNKDAERALVGSLVDSHQFKPGGLVKKTISVQYKGIQNHLVSYYNIDDVVQKKLRTPLESPEMQHITPRAALISAEKFRAPVGDHELTMDDRMRVLIAQGHFPPDLNLYGDPRSMPVPNIHHGYQTGWAIDYTMQTIPHAVNPHTLSPPAVYFPHPQPGYSDEVSRLPAQLPNFPSMQMPSWRYNSYESMPYLNGSLIRNTPVVSSIGIPGSSLLDGHEISHSSFSAQSVCDSPAASAAFSHYGAMYDSSARHAAPYDGSSSQSQNISSLVIYKRIPCSTRLV